MPFLPRDIPMKPMILASLLMLPAVSWAQDAPSPPPVQESQEDLEPDVTIRQQDEKTIHEYRINGRLYMVKIVPQKGPPYYLLDLDGDGEMDTQEDDLGNVVVPQWVLFRW
ncbi:DUF2782 domain-containing protein [Thiolapillus sp.]